MFKKKTQKAGPDPYELCNRIWQNAELFSRAVEATGRQQVPEQSRIALLDMIGASAPVTMSELASRSQVSKPTMSVNLKKMITAGLVDSEPNPVDKRSTCFFLTGKGQARLELAKRARQEMLTSAIEGQDQANLAILEMALPILEQIAGRISTASGK